MSTQTIPVAIEDLIEVEQVGGDLQVEGWERPELEARGDRVQIAKRTGAVVISCGSDLVLSVPHSCRLVVHTIGGDARLQKLSGDVEVELVGGDATLQNLTGPVFLNGLIEGDTRLENVANVSMNANKLDPGFNMAERLRRKVEHAARRAETKVKRVEHKALHHAQLRSHLADSGRWKYNGPQDASSTGEPGQQVSDEERLTILRMLQEQKITSEQAEKLFAALEGSA